jgi:hypothetical protein
VTYFNISNFEKEIYDILLVGHTIKLGNILMQSIIPRTKINQENFLSELLLLKQEHINFGNIVVEY